jgi:hypothetical protein
MDLSNYTADNAEGFSIQLIGTDAEVTAVDQFKIWYRSRTTSPTNYIGGLFKENSADTYTSVEYPGILPTKLKISRIDTILYISYYMLGAWYVNGSQDFGVRAPNITKLWIMVEDLSLHGGSVDIDNLLIESGTESYNIYYLDTPGVTTSTGTKISGVTSPYDHTPPILGTTYYYIITAENAYAESDASTEVSARTAPDVPTNVSVIEGFEKNTLSWTSGSGATSDNIYWAQNYYPNEYFDADLSNWTTYKLQGGEYVSIVSNKLKTELYDSVSLGWDLIYNTELPINNFTVEVDMDTYTPSDSNNGHYAYFYIKDTYSGSNDYVFIRYHTTVAGTTHNIRTNLVLNGADSITDITISGTPTKFRIKRVANLISIYYYVSSWILVDSLDFGARASLLDYVQLSGEPNSSNGGLIEFDDVVYWPDLKENGTKITSETSPYEHTSLTKGEDYFYAVVSENESGEGTASLQVMGTPFGTPNPPTTISVTKGGGLNTINFTVDAEATQTHIYWGTSPGVTTITGTKISDVTSPYIHSSLDPDPRYYYILTSENGYGEGDPSSEYNNSPYPTPPTGVGVSADIEKNTLVWTNSLGADSYNIYWRTSPGVTKINSTKISGVTSPYIHTGLTPYLRIYYVITAEDEDGESNTSSEVSAEPWPPEGPGLPQSLVEQYSILEAFSENTNDQMKKLVYPLIGTPPVTGHSTIAGDLYDMTEPLDFNSCIADDSFSVERLSSTSIKVLSGICIIGGVCIDIRRSKTLYINSEDSYFSWVNVISGAGTVYILVYYDSVYNSSLNESLAYVGLMKKTDYAALTTAEKKYYCFIGAIKVNSSVEIISPLYYYDPDNTSQERPHPKGFADGGWLDIPEEFII